MGRNPLIDFLISPMNVGYFRFSASWVGLAGINFLRKKYSFQ